MSNEDRHTLTSAASLMLATGLRPSQQVVLGADVLPVEAIGHRLLRVVFAWNALDYLLRIVLKRLRKVSIDDPSMVPVMEGMTTHSDVMAAIAKELAGDPRLAEFEQIRATIGTRKVSGSLYDQRNHAIHSIFARTPDGAEFFRRVGHEGYRAPSPVDAAFLDQLAGRIGSAIERLSGLVPP